MGTRRTASSYEDAVADHTAAADHSSLALGSAVLIGRERMHSESFETLIFSRAPPLSSLVTLVTYPSFSLYSTSVYGSTSVGEVKSNLASQISVHLAPLSPLSHVKHGACT